MNPCDTKKWAKKLLDSHSNPLRKMELHRKKLFLPTDTENETELVVNLLEIVRNTLDTERAERRCARGIANWLPDERLAEVTKTIGIVNSFSFANINGRFLYPEDIMFLLETNRLELFWNSVPVSIQQAFEILLNATNCSQLAKYTIYRELALRGFHLFRTSHIQKREIAEGSSPKKIKLEDLPKNNKTQEDEEQIETRKLQDPHNKMFDEIFDKLQKHCPKKFVLSERANDCVDYKCFVPDNPLRNIQDFNLEIQQDKYLKPIVNVETIPTVIGYTDSNTIGFFQILPIEACVP